MEIRAVVEIVIEVDRGELLAGEVAPVLKAAEQTDNEVTQAIANAVRWSLDTPSFYAPDGNRACYLGGLLSADVERWELVPEGFHLGGLMAPGTDPLDGLAEPDTHADEDRPEGWSEPRPWGGGADW